MMKIYKENNEAIPAVKILPDTDPAPSGFTEITDIVEAEKLGNGSTNKNIPGWSDRLKLRDKLKELIYSKMTVTDPADVDDPAKWNNLTADEKRIAANYFIVGNEAFFTEVKADSRYWILKAGDYREWTQEIRAHRAALCEAVIFLRMQNIGDAKLLLSDLNQIAKDTVIDQDDLTKKLNTKVRVKRLNRMYIEGLQDEEHDGVVAIKDWICSKPGTPFQSNGFKNTNYPLKTGHTLDSVADEMIAILDGDF